MLLLLSTVGAQVTHQEEKASSGHLRRCASKIRRKTRITSCLVLEPGEVFHFPLESGAGVIIISEEQLDREGPAISVEHCRLGVERTRVQNHHWFLLGAVCTSGTNENKNNVIDIFPVCLDFARSYPKNADE
jgi:hypothetical protein